MTGPREPRSELVIVDRRSSAVAERAFPRDPSLVDPSNGPTGTVGPDAPTTTAGTAEPVVIDGDELEAALPGPRLAASPWAGWPGQWQPAWGNGGGAGAGVIGNRVSTVFSCTALNANALGSMPVSLTEQGRPIDPDMYEWTENPEPALYSDWSEFIVQAVLSLLTRGDLYVHGTGWNFDTLLPERFMVVDPDRVTCHFAADGSTRNYWINGEPVMFPWDLVHVRFLSAAGWPTGLSPLQAVAGNLRSAGALERYGADIADGGGIPWGTLTSDERLTRRQVAIARQEWIESARDRAGGPAIFGQGLKLETLTLSPRDMALLDLRVFDEQRIAAAFGVPPFLIGLPQPEGLTYANATSLFDFHWRGMLRPLSRKITAALSRWALPRGRKVALVAGDYVQPPLAERATAYGAMNAAQALDVDEWRALEGLPPRTPGQATAAVANTTAGSAVAQ